jgi:hypothetical protein
VPALFVWGIVARKGIPVMPRDAGVGSQIVGEQR